MNGRVPDAGRVILTLQSLSAPLATARARPSSPTPGPGSAVWFQQMDGPRPQCNRIHFDVAVPRDEGQRRIQALISAGGRLGYDAEAPAFWVFADGEGNEACITRWQGRDERS